MQMQNLFKLKSKIKKSHTLLVGSLFVFFGLSFLCSDYFLKIKDELYTDMKIAMMDVSPTSVSQVAENTDVPLTTEEFESIFQETDYSKYLGVLEIPKIGLKRGFYSADNRYNNIEHNVTIIPGSDLPDVPNGNLILIAHSGYSYIAFFANLYQLGLGDDCYVLYNGQAYHYQIVNIYDVEKNGVVEIDRNYDKNTLTLVTCTKDSDHLQTVYIAEFVG